MVLGLSSISEEVGFSPLVSAVLVGLAVLFQSRLTPPAWNPREACPRGAHSPVGDSTPTLAERKTLRCGEANPAGEVDKA